MKEIFHVLHLVGLAMSVGTGFAMMTLARSTAGLPPEERGKFMSRAMVLSKVGSTGLLLLIVSGVPLLWVLKWAPMAWGLFHVKLTLVAIQVVLLGTAQMMIAKAKKAGTLPMPKPIVPMLLFINGLIILVVATVIFH